MNIINILEQMKNTPIDDKVGIAVVKGVEEPGVSIGLAVVKDRIRPHYQKISDEIYYILEGEGEAFIGEESHHVKQGDVLSIPKGTVHSFINKGQEPCLILFSSGPRFDPDTDRFFPDEESV